MQSGRAVGRMSREEAERIATAALSFLAEDSERLGRFLSMTGLGPDNLRRAAAGKGFLGQVMGHLADDESLLLAFAADRGENPSQVAAAHRLLAGPHYEREDP